MRNANYMRIGEHINWLAMRNAMWTSILQLINLSLPFFSFLFSHDLWSIEGVKGFYKGIVPNLLRVTPACAITFVVYENTSHFLLAYASAPTVAGNLNSSSSSSPSPSPSSSVIKSTWNHSIVSHFFSYLGILILFCLLFFLSFVQETFSHTYSSLLFCVISQYQIVHFLLYFFPSLSISSLLFHSLPQLFNSIVAY